MLELDGDSLVAEKESDQKREREVDDFSVKGDQDELLIRCDKKVTGIDEIEFEGGAFLSKSTLSQQHSVIKSLDNKVYADQVLQPVDDIQRPSALAVLHLMADKVLEESQFGPLTLARIELRGNPSDKHQSVGYEVAVVVQNRAVKNGVWLPEHHDRVSNWLTEISAKRLPVITFIDTPGADAGNQANLDFQAASISKLITRFTRLDVPTLGVIYGKGYSGGAIPLAATNLLFSLKDAVFNTIQPQGLAAIARKEKLSWQECAQWVGISAVELVFDGVIDGVIDYSPMATEQSVIQLKSALLEGLESLLQKINEGEDIRDLRWQTLRNRLSFQEPNYQQQASSERIHIQLQPTRTPDTKSTGSGDEVTKPAFDLWLGRSQPVRYHKQLADLWKLVQAGYETRNPSISGSAGGRIGQTISYSEFQTLETFALELATELYHQWQSDFGECLLTYKGAIAEWPMTDLESFIDQQNASGQVLELSDFLRVQDVQELLLHHLELFKLLDVSYDLFLSEICSVAWEYSLEQTLSEDTVQKLWRNAQTLAIKQGVDRDRAQRFLNWLDYLDQNGRLQKQINQLNEWKQRQFPRTDQALLVVAGYYVSTLLIRLHSHQVRGVPFSGAFQPAQIGRQKNFWYRITQASRNVRIQELLDQTKTQRLVASESWVELLFDEFELLDEQLITKDPKVFPGFAKRIKQTLEKGQTPCGLVTGLGTLKGPTNADKQVAFFTSNTDFQAGAFDMASAEKLCRLLERAAMAGLPVIGLVSSAGMQTKEGAAALFSMAVVNEAIARFVETGGRLLMIGYGDCTGGAQASFVTHPDVDTYYLSGTNLPFAGQVVVPEHLTLQACLSNYLASDRKEIEGVIRHPLMAGLDRQLREIDPSLMESELTLTDVISDWLVDLLNGSSKAQVSGSQHSKRKQYGKIDQVLVHARGCTALRLVQAAHQHGKQVVLVQSDPDMNSTAAKSLVSGDRLVCLGGQSSDESYLNAHSVLRVAELEKVDALHPGIGFLSENAGFAQSCLLQNLNFIGPDASAIERMGDKAQAVETALQAGVPTIPGSGGVVSSFDEAKQVMDAIGLPLLIKASHGGGGKGIGTVEHAEQLKHTLLRVQQEAKSAFGCADVYIERLLESVRHIEIQVLRDRFGNFRMAGVRDCSSQRNRQKLIEESGEYVLTGDQIRSLDGWSSQLCDQIDYVGVGTLEFLYDLDRNCFYFMEMNTRLQVEHIVTEMTSGIDLVEQQFLIAEGQSIEALPSAIAHQGHAIEVRINAEALSVKSDDEGKKLVVTPASGRFSKVFIPEQDYARVLSVAEPGQEMLPFYDNLIAQIVVHGKDRREALTHLIELLDETVIDGVETNLPLIKELLATDDFRCGDISTQFVERWAQEKGDVLTLISEISHNPVESSAQPFLEKDSGEWLLKLPSTGVVYSSPSPDSSPFIKEGDVVSGNQALMLLEVMKMFMPITLNQFFPFAKKDDSFEVVHRRELDGQYVQQGEVILTLKPL